MLVSPDELMKAAREHMLEGRDPESKRDWELVMNFVAANVDPEIADVACRLLGRMYDVPLSEGHLEGIAKFQVECKRK